MAKELYFSNSLEGLKQKCHIHIPKSTTYVKCLDSMEKLNRCVSDAKKSKDEELEFHALHRFFIFSSFLSNAVKNINNNISDQKIQQRKKHLHELAKKHLLRYEELDNILSNRYDALDKARNNRVTPTPSVSQVTVTTSRKTSDSSKPVTPTISEINAKGSISCNHLFALINDKTRKDSVLIIDVRSARDFKNSCLLYSQLLNIPEELIDVGLSAEKLKEKLSGDSLELWSKRSHVDLLVLMDWSSTSSSPPVSKLFALRNIMRQWDPLTTYKSNPIILEGGFEEILERYPQITTNPKVEVPRVPISKSVDELMDFDYPMEDLEPQRPKTAPPMPKPPEAPEQRHSAPAVIDRSTKPQLKLTNENVNSLIDELADSMSDDEVLPLRPSPTPTPAEKEPPSEHIATSDAVRMQESSDEDTTPDVTLEPSVDSREPTRPDPDMVENLRKLKPTNLNNNERPVEPRNHTIDGKGDEVNRSWSRSSANDNDISHQPLKKDGSTGGILRRTSSSPNIAKLRDDEPLGHVPSFSRANKPFVPRKHHFVYRESADCVYGKTAPGLTGLKNFANNCYMNSIVQCLNNTEPLVNALMRLEDSPAFNYSGRLKGRIAQEMIQAFRYMWSGEVKIYSIRELKNLMGEIKDIFKGSMHQDSNEFLIILLEHLHDDLNMPAEVGTLIGAEEKTGEKAWGEFRRKNCSIIQQLFYGQHKSTVTCCTCGHASATFEQFFNLFVPIPSNQNAVSLNDCIQLYMSGEKICGWKCPECKTERNAMKKIDISRLPPVLVIALKRFTQEDDSWLHKKENLVTYPLDNLDMSRFTVPGSEQRNRVYSLYAMSTHSGTLQSGHYRAICKSFNTKRWYMFDDQSVEPLSESAVLSNSEVYILFYIAKQPS